MYKKNKLFLSFIVLNFLLSCASFDEAGKVLKNEKIKTTDEFLVKKRDPLILPPDFKNVPKPGSTDSKKFNEKGICFCKLSINCRIYEYIRRYTCLFYTS